MRDGTALLWFAEVGNSCLQLIVYSLWLVSWLFADNLQISFDFLGGFEEKVYFCG